MAITDMKGTVATTTGLMNETPATPKVPNMSKIKMPTNREVRSTEKPIKKTPVRTVAQPKKVTDNLAQKIEGLTDEDKATLGIVLSPSVSKVISKIAPDIKPLLDQFTKDEENVILPVSLVKNFANRKYGGQTEQDSLKSFVMINNYTISELLFNSKFIVPFIFILLIILMSGAFKKIIVKKSK